MKVDEIKKMVADLMSDVDIGKKYGVNARTIRNFRKRHGIESSRNAIIEKAQQVIIDSYNRHKCHKKVAEDLGKSAWYMRSKINRLKRDGLIKQEPITVPTVSEIQMTPCERSQHFLNRIHEKRMQKVKELGG